MTIDFATSIILCESSSIAEGAVTMKRLSRRLLLVRTYFPLPESHKMRESRRTLGFTSGVHYMDTPLKTV